MQPHPPSTNSGTPAARARFLPRTLLWVASRVLPWETVTRMYRREGDRLLAIARTLSAETLRKRIRIRPLWGVDPGSQDWSVALVVQHLMLVELQFARILIDLSFNRVPKVELDLRTPVLDEDYPGDVLEDFQEALNDFTVRLTADIGDTESATKYRHPALGPLDCREWQVLAAFVQWSRRQQAQEIVRGLQTSDS